MFRCLASTALTLLSVHGQDARVPGGVELSAATRQVLAACNARNSAVIARKLVDLGPDAAVELTRVAMLGREDWTEAQRSAIEQALHERVADTRTALVTICSVDSTFELHARALELLAKVGTARDLSTAVQLAQSAAVPDEAFDQDGAPLDPTLALRACAARLIEREPRISDDFTRALRECRGEPAVGLIDALVDLARPADMELLGELLRQRVWNARYLIGAIARIARQSSPPFDDRVRAPVRDQLRAFDASCVREAASCAGWLEDADAADDLADLLAHGDGGVRTSARWALRRITGRNFAAQAEPWRRWLTEQQTWWSQRAGDLFDQINRGNEVARIAALNEVLRHRWPRHELARELVQVLPFDDRAAIELGCAALTSLGSRTALPRLRELLEVVDEDLRAPLESAIAHLDAAPGPGSVDSPEQRADGANSSPQPAAEPRSPAPARRR